MRPQQLALWPAPNPRHAAREGKPRSQPAPADLPVPAAEPRRSEGRAAVLPWAPPARPDNGAPLAARLATLLREPVEVELTDNAWTMVSYRRSQGRLRFRLHHMFSAASEPVVRAVANFTGRARRAAGRVIDDYIAQHRHLIKLREGRREPALQQRGAVHDLADIFAQLNSAHFAGRVLARIGWGRRAPLRKRRSIKMGVYFHDRKLIRIHPALDDTRVPRLFVEMVVFHEMLHQVIPPRVDGEGRRCVHGAEFRAAERAFPGYEQARAWERANLGVLLRQRA
jgi:hypothetical protein